MTSIILLATTYILLLHFPSSTATTTTTTIVFDISGNPLKPNTPYYILPVVRGRGGGITMSPKNNTAPCPLYAAQENQEVSNGKPIKFYPLKYPTQKDISLSSDLNFVFAAYAKDCNESTGWRLTLDEVTGRRYVGLGGVIGEPGIQTLSNWFKFEKAGSGKYDYKIVFCPSVCNFCKVLCGDVGVFLGEDGKRLLGFNLSGQAGQPLLVMIKKAY